VGIDSVKFILDVLKQQRNDLDRIITKLGHMTAEFNKIDKLMDKIQLIADDLSDLLRKKHASIE
jgi:ABC-type transporter Mla subunit MlaD